MQVAVWLTRWPLPESRDQRVAANAAWSRGQSATSRASGAPDLFFVKDAPNVDEAEQYLGMSASEGRYMVTAQTGPDSFYDLIGDPDAEGEEEDFCIGGQAAGWPRRKLVSVEDAVEVALRYLRHGRLAGGRVWEGQDR
jgi:hypothetical protein